MMKPEDRAASVGAPLAAEDEPPDLSDQGWDDAPVLVLFWALAFVVFLQFFTRYVLNDSIAWTEEIARYMLIGVTFLGSVMAVRKRSHIAVEFLYRWFSRPLRRIFQTLVDLASIAFYAALTVWTVQLSQRTQQAMVSIDVPKSLIYWIVAACFAMMTLYALRVAWTHWRTGTSRLIDPDRHRDTAPLTE
jgi:TRAP-type C4-dicarboxylate transport system permease small subunit